MDVIKLHKNSFEHQNNLLYRSLNDILNVGKLIEK